MTLWIAKAHHRHIAMLAASHLHNPLILLRFAVPAAPAALATVTTSLRLYACHHSRLQVSRSMPTCASHMVYLLKQPRCDLVCVHPPPLPPLQPRVSTTQVGTRPVRLSATYKRSASTALAGTHNPVGADPRAGTGPFPEPRALVLPMVKFGQTKPDGLGRIDTADSDLVHHQFRLSVLQWNPGPARRNTTNIIATACGRFHAVILQEASDHALHIPDQFIAHTGNTDLAILHVKVLVQVPGFLASKFNEIFSKLCTTSELLTRQSVRTSTIVPTLLYNSQSLAFLLALLIKTLRNTR